MFWSDALQLEVAVHFIILQARVSHSRQEMEHFLCIPGSRQGTQVCHSDGGQGSAAGCRVITACSM